MSAKTEITAAAARILSYHSCLNLNLAMTAFDAPDKNIYSKPCEGKGENAGNQLFLLFPQGVLPFPREIVPFETQVECRLHMLSV